MVHILWFCFSLAVSPSFGAPKAAAHPYRFLTPSEFDRRMTESASIHPASLSPQQALQDLDALEAAVSDIWRQRWDRNPQVVPVRPPFERARRSLPKGPILLERLRALLESALGEFEDSHLYLMGAGDVLGRILEPSSPVLWRKLAPSIGLLRIDRFPEPGQPFGEQFSGLIDRAFLGLRDTEGLILDLRGNAGGDPNQADRLFDYIASTTVFLYSEVVRRSDAMSSYVGSDVMGRWEWKEGGSFCEPLDILYEPQDPGFKYGGKVLVLADAGTVSAAEYVLGALLDNGLARFAGERTPGRSGSVVPAELPSSRLVAAIPVQHTLRRDGTALQGKGIIPDFSIPPRAPDLLARAADILRGEIRPQGEPLPKIVAGIESLAKYLPLAGLAILMGLVLALPFSVKKVEEELEAFLFAMGLLAVTISGRWEQHLVGEALLEPVKIAVAVLVVGFVFRAMRSRVRKGLNTLVHALGRPLAIGLVVFSLGLASSVITAIIAALILAEVVTALRLERRYEIRLVVCACYAIGLGAVLTPLGEPLSTIVVAKLKGPPHHADFFYLARLLGFWVVPGVLLMAVLSGWKVGHHAPAQASLTEDRPEGARDIVLRAFKVYLFVMALVLLGAGLVPLAERTVALVPGWGLYWINIISAVLDNATLAAAEIVPSMGEGKITLLLMGLLVSGGMLIPGNIPNIISAAKLGIKSREWAAAAVPMGAVLMLAYFLALLAFL